MKTEQYERDESDISINNTITEEYNKYICYYIEFMSY